MYKDNIPIGWNKSNAYRDGGRYYKNKTSLSKHLLTQRDLRWLFTTTHVFRPTISPSLLYSWQTMFYPNLVPDQRK